MLKKFIKHLCTESTCKVDQTLYYFITHTARKTFECFLTFYFRRIYRENIVEFILLLTMQSASLLD